MSHFIICVTFYLILCVTFFLSYGRSCHIYMCHVFVWDLQELKLQVFCVGVTRVEVTSSFVWELQEWSQKVFIMELSL